MGLVDSHAHLTDKAFEQDLDEVIVRAKAAGVERILTLGTDVKSSRAAVALADKYPTVYAAVGIHPEAVRKATLEDLEIIRDLSFHRCVVAIGEIGLDYYRDKESAGLQRTFFEKQIEIAAERQLPVSVHDREAHLEITETFQKLKKLGVTGVLHAFSGDDAMAREALELGLFLSFAGPITFLNERRAPQILRLVPLGKMLIETDSPYLTPHPLRGRRNEPARTALVAGRVAEIKGCTLDQVAEETTRNARMLFGF